MKVMPMKMARDELFEPTTKDNLANTLMVIEFNAGGDKNQIGMASGMS